MNSTAWRDRPPSRSFGRLPAARVAGLSFVNRLPPDAGRCPVAGDPQVPPFERADSFMTYDQPKMGGYLRREGLPDGGVVRSKSKVRGPSAVMVACSSEVTL